MNIPRRVLCFGSKSKAIHYYMALSNSEQHFGIRLLSSEVFSLFSVKDGVKNFAFEFLPLYEL